MFPRGNNWTFLNRPHGSSRPWMHRGRGLSHAPPQRPEREDEEEKEVEWLQKTELRLEGV